MIETTINTAEEVFDKLIEYTLQKDAVNALSLYDDSEIFKFIDDEGKVLNFQQLVEMYNNLFEQLEYVEILESSISYEQLSSDVSLCFWTGKELIKMKEVDEMESAWTATVIVKQLEDGWKIIHFHLTH